MIKTNNFISSKGDDHWLGEGIYFFTAGISASPIDNASDWAIASAWNKSAKSLNYTQFCVISADISCEKADFWDLSTEDGLKEFNYARDLILKKLSSKYSLPSNEVYRDSDIIEVVCKRMNYLVIKSNFYIKFKRERIEQIKSRIPNTTVINARSSSVIALSSIKLVKEGEIK
ncbi:hypothetical protein [Leptospira meyeri]|uniref:hypothetical protein n=1 Tax=Leptospira meyeri TaxID=29508 RepID=UPI000C2B34E8|nr:hypothetical protein [Leptospira meyeri]PKA23959.1 hypothetical protein CH381_23160 [Leptospira sp. mixed culture ATI2-C-A1]